MPGQRESLVCDHVGRNCQADASEKAIGKKPTVARTRPYTPWCTPPPPGHRGSRAALRGLLAMAV